MPTLIGDKDDNSLLTRRSIVTGAVASLICAPAIVRVTSLMPVRRLPFPHGRQYAGFVDRLHLRALERHLVGLDATSSIFLGGRIDVAKARERVAFAQAHGFLPPYICIYRDN
jgi:hypothetical protein